MKDSDSLPAHRGRRACAARPWAAGVLGAALLAATGAVGGQPADAWGSAAPFEGPHGSDPGERHRERQQLREQLRAERHRPAAPPGAEPLGAGGPERLSPEERDALRQHVRKLAPHRHGP